MKKHISSCKRGVDKEGCECWCHKSMKKTKKVKGWLILKRRNGKPDRFATEAMPPHYVAYERKKFVNEDFHQLVPCTITYSLPKKRVGS